MVPKGHGDSENRGGTTLESVAEYGNTQTRGTGGAELSVEWGQANERPPRPRLSLGPSPVSQMDCEATVCKRLSCASTSSGQFSLVARVRPRVF